MTICSSDSVCYFCSWHSQGFGDYCAVIGDMCNLCNLLSCSDNLVINNSCCLQRIDGHPPSSLFLVPTATYSLDISGRCNNNWNGSIACYRCNRICRRLLVVRGGGTRTITKTKTKTRTKTKTVRGVFCPGGLCPFPPSSMRIRTV